jgi:cyclopropane fatty-acyl-phospholipid synthase-like methyltransferase
VTGDAPSPPGALTYEAFRLLALDDALSANEKIGFPDSYRDGTEATIVEDVLGKLRALGEERQRVLEIGPGCGELARRMIDVYRERRHDAVLVDSPEMLDQLPDEPWLTKLPGAFPDAAAGRGDFDAVLAYSVLQHVHADGDVVRFFDAAVGALAPGGALLLGDVPNATKRARFFRSAAG